MDYRRLGLAALFGFACRPADSVPGVEAAAAFVIRDVTVIDGTGAPARPHQRVTVRGGRIESVEPDGPGSTAPAGARPIDGTGKFLIPGLWDTHVHLADLGEEAIPLLPTYGITSVRDAGGDPARLASWRSRIESGEIIGPRIRSCGPMLEGEWDPTSVGGRTDHWVVESPERAREIVGRLAAEGVDCIKVRSYATAETFFALAAAAAEHGLPLVVHPLGAIDPVASSDAGVASYEHAFYPWPWNGLAEERKREIESAFRRNGSVVVPTLIAWQTFRLPVETIRARVHDRDAKLDVRSRQVSASLRRNWIFGVEDFEKMSSGSPGWNEAIDQVYEQVAELLDHGVGVMAGTDTGVALVFPGSALHEELELLVRSCRLTPLEALSAATLVPARFFGMEERLGTIEAGKLADLVLLSGDPLEDIANVRKVDGVMLRGRWLDRIALDGLVAEVEKQVARRDPAAKE